MCLAVTHWTGAFADDTVASDGLKRTAFVTAHQVAASWNAKEPSGAEVEFDKLLGRPCVIVLFRGHGCYHCVQQLGEVAKVESRFRSRGVRLIAVSDESVESMVEALENRPLPFPVLSDSTSKLAKSLGSDSVENWHGTLLIDAKGRAQWLVSGSRPLMDFREVFT